MKKIIEKIRNKPSHHRDRIIWVTALGAVGVLLIVWAIVGNGHKTNQNENFFDTFSEGLEEGKSTFPEDPLNP